MSSAPIQNLINTIDLQAADISVALERNSTPDLDAPFYPTDETLCKLANLVYKTSHQEISNFLGANDDWKEWTLLTTGKSNTWSDNYFGAAFWNEQNRQLVIAHKGTSSFTDVKADIKGVMQNNYTNQIHMACTFAFQVLEKFRTGDFSISITGHSLGAWLAQITAFAVEYLRVEGNNFFKLKEEEQKYHPHTVVFDSPGCKQMLCKISDDYFDRYEKDLISLLDITTYFIKPNKINSTNNHVGKLLSFVDELSELVEKKKTGLTAKIKNKISNLLLDKPTTDYHGIEMFLQAFKKPDKIFQVSNWPTFSNTKRVAYKISFGSLSEDTEYNEYLNNVLQTFEVPDFEKENEKFIKIHFNIKKFDQTFLKSNIFKENELIFLKNWSKLRENHSEASVINSFFLEKGLQVTFDNFVPNFEFLKYGIRCVEWEKVVNCVKRLFVDFPEEVTDAMKNQILKTPLIFQAIYNARMDAYIENLPKLEICFKDNIGLKEFLNKKQDHVMILKTDNTIKTENTKDVAFRVYNILNSEDIKINENEYSLFSVKDVKYIEKNVSVTDVFKSESKIDELLIIDFGDTNDFTILNDLNQTISENTKKQIICITEDTIPENLNINHRLIEVGEATLNDLHEDSLDLLFGQNIMTLNGNAFTLNGFLKKDDTSSLSELPISALREFLTQGRIIKQNFKNDIFNRIHFNLTTAKVLKDIKIGNLRDILENYDYKLKPITQKSIEEIKFLITGRNENQDLAELIQSYGDQIIFHHSTDQEESSKLFYETCLEHSDKIIYRLHMSNPENDVLMWIDVYNPDLYMKRKYSIKPKLGISPIVVNEQELVARKEKIVLISNTPGMGKSTTLLNLAKGISNSWVFWINLIEAHKYVEKSSLVDLNFVIKFLLQANNISSKLAENLLKFSLTNENSVPIYLFFDAFDEIQDCENKKKEMIRDKILRIIKFLKNETSAKIIISTRTYESKFLTEQLGTDSVSLTEIKEEEQIKFCTKFWMSTFSLVKYDLSDIKKMIHSYTERSLMRFTYSLRHSRLSLLGVPLQLRMIVEIFTPHEIEEDSFVDANFNFNLYELYLKFINHKYEIYFNEKTCFIQETNKNLLTPSYQKTHRNLGMNFLFPEFSKKINYGTLTYINQIGLAHIHGKTISFIHRTFAECFAAEQFVHLMDNKPEENVQIFLVENLFSNRNYAMIQRFINDILVTNKKNKNTLQFYPEIWAKKARYLILEKESDRVTEWMQWMKYFMPLIEYNATKLMELILENFKYRSNLKSDVISTMESEATLLYEAIRIQRTKTALMLLGYGANVDRLKLTTFTKKGRILRGDNYYLNCNDEYSGIKRQKIELKKKSYLHLTSPYEKLNPVSLKLLQITDNQFPNYISKNPWDLAAERHNWNFFFDAFGYFKKNDSALQKWGTEVFLQAVQNDNMHVAITLLDKDIDFADEKLLEKFEYGRWNLIMMLLDLRKSKYPNQDDKDIIRQFLSMNNIWDYILEELEDINTRNAKKQTFLHFAIALNKMDIAHELINEKQANVNAIDTAGKTPIYLAAKNGHWNIILRLSDKIDFKILGPYKENLLDMACEQNQKKTALYLIENKIIDICTPYEKPEEYNPLLIAARKGYWNLVTELIRKVKNLEVSENIDVQKWTTNESFLHFARRDNKTTYLIDNGDQEKVSDRKRDTAESVSAEREQLNLEKTLAGLKNFDTNITKRGVLTLHDACQNNQVDLVLELITNKGIDVNCKDENGNTPALLAAERGHWDLVAKLVKLQGFKDIPDRFGDSLLHLACQNNKIDLAFELIEKEADTNHTNEVSHNAITTAAEHGNWDLVEKLMEKYSSKIDFSNRYRFFKFLYSICNSSKVNLLSPILERKIEVNVPADDDHEFVPILLAANKNQWEMVEQFMRLDTLLNVNVANEKNETLLHYACQSNKRDLVLRLIGRGADINIPDIFGDTPVLRAARYGHSELVKTLIEKLIQNNEFNVNIKNEYDTSLLHFACIHNNADLAFILIDKGANLDSVDKDNNTPILLAAGNGHWELVRKLKEKNASLNKINVHNETLLHLACRDDEKELAHDLIRSGLDINFPNGYGRTPLFFAADFSHWDLVSELLKLGADPNVRDKDKTTILHLACRDNEMENAVMLITEKRLNPTETDMSFNASH